MKILVVDDTKTARYAMRLELQKHGIAVEMADSAESALEWLKTELPDAILMDHIMTGMNGLEALEIIKSDPRTARLPVVMATSQEDPEFARNAIRKGALGLLPKAVPSETQAKLPEMLDRIRAAIAAAPAAAPELPAAPIEQLVEQRLDALLAPRLRSLAAELRRELTEQLRAETQALIEQSKPGPRPEMTGMRTLIDQAVAVAVPDRTTLAQEAKQAVEAVLSERLSLALLEERSKILTLLDQNLQALGTPSPAEGAALNQRLAALDDTITNKALLIARREAQTAVERAREADRQTAGTLETALQSSLKRLYALIAAAALVGIAAAFAVPLLFNAT